MFVDLKDYGLDAYSAQAAQNNIGNTSLIAARIIECRRELFTIICEHGEAAAELKGSFYHKLKTEDEFPAVGDFVLVQYNKQGSSLITELLPRRSKFSRTNFGGHAESYTKFIKEQVVAVNFDYVFIVTSMNHDFNPGRLGRYLSAAWQSNGFPVIILTKADLCENLDPISAEARKLAREVPVIPISSKTGYGLEELIPFLEPAKTIVFLGSSGVGKSSLLNRLAGDELMEVKSIRDDDSKGRHTTSHRQLFRLPSGALVIDTPGMRELGLWDAREGMDIAFAELNEIASQCRFSDCTHQREPGCAIQAALANGSLQPKQWKQYLTQQREARFVENHSDYMKKKQAFHKSIALFSKAFKKDSR